MLTCLFSVNLKISTLDSEWKADWKASTVIVLSLSLMQLYWKHVSILKTSFAPLRHSGYYYLWPIWICQSACSGKGENTHFRWNLRDHPKSWLQTKKRIISLVKFPLCLGNILSPQYLKMWRGIELKTLIKIQLPVWDQVCLDFSNFSLL